MEIRSELRGKEACSPLSGEGYKLKIFTININLAWKLEVKYTDITVKSGDPVFASTWDMVMGHKQGKVSDEKYISTYLDRMRRSYRLRLPEGQEVRLRVCTGTSCASSWCTM